MELGPEIEVHRHHHTGRAWIDVALGVSAVTISLISLILAIGNETAMKRLVAANSWPYVSVDVSNVDEQGDKVFRLMARNKGIGPAKIQTIEVFYEGQPVPNPHALIHAILGSPTEGTRIPFIASSFSGEVLASREQISILAVNGKSIAPDKMDKLSDGTRNIGFRICYCSVFDECWISDRTRETLPPAPVKFCPIPKTPFTL